jgi:hypothetical protein
MVSRKYTIIFILIVVVAVIAILLLGFFIYGVYGLMIRISEEDMSLRVAYQRVDQQIDLID